MKNSTVTIEQLAEKLGQKVWSKGDLKRIYLNSEGFNTKKMSTKTFIYQNENGDFKVSCKIECPSQGYQWISSQEEIVKEGVYTDIERALSEMVYIMVDKDGKHVNYKKEEISLNKVEFFYTESEAKKEIDNCTYYDGYITMNRSEFEKEVERLDSIDLQNKPVESEKPTTEKPQPKPIEIPKLRENNNQTFKVGMKVKHKTFGIGEIIGADTKKVSISFPVGEKCLLIKYANLEIVENLSNIKSFNDLIFEHHELSKSGHEMFDNAKQSIINFENGYGVSVLIGSCFYSNGIDTYELAVLFNGAITYNTDITDDVLGHLSKEEVSQIMLKVQELI